MLKRQELARQLANRKHISEAQACDELDQVVHRILTSLRQGQVAEVLGVGHLMGALKEQAKAEPKTEIKGGAGKKSKA